MSSELTVKARALAGAASAGPWRNQNDRIEVHQDFVVLDYFMRCATLSQCQADGNFIAEARTLVPALCDENDEWLRRVDCLEISVEAYQHGNYALQAEAMRLGMEVESLSVSRGSADSLIPEDGHQFSGSCDYCGAALIDHISTVDAQAARIRELEEALTLVRACTVNSREAPNVLDTIAAVAGDALARSGGVSQQMQSASVEGADLPSQVSVTDQEEG